MLEGTLWTNPRIRHAHSVVPNRTQFTPPSPPSSDHSDPDDSMDTDEEEVDFWGGESPRSRLMSPIHGHDMAVDDSEEENDDDSEDEEMSDDDDEEGEEDEADGYNRMDIFGHR